MLSFFDKSKTCATRLLKSHMCFMRIQDLHKKCLFGVEHKIFGISVDLFEKDVENWVKLMVSEKKTRSRHIMTDV